MDPQQVFCPNIDCRARGEIGQGNIGVHQRKERRYICHHCKQTFVESKGTPLYRLHHERGLFFIVVLLLAHGCPRAAIVAAYGLDERTVADWQDKSGQHSQAVHEHLVEQPRDLQHVQADELRSKRQGAVLWLAMAIMVSTRLWLGGVVSQQRDERLLIRLLAQVRASALARPLLICVDGLAGYLSAIGTVFRSPQPTGKRGRPRLVAWPDIHIGQVVKQYQHGHVVGVVRRMAQGTWAAAQSLLQRSRGGQQLNTAFIERLNATFRSRLAALARRSRCLVRQEQTLQAALYLVGTVYNFCTPHDSLRQKLWVGERSFRWVHRTPAMAAGITDHCWSVQDLLNFHIPPPRWLSSDLPATPPAALAALIESWTK